MKLKRSAQLTLVGLVGVVGVAKYCNDVSTAFFPSLCCAYTFRFAAIVEFAVLSLGVYARSCALRLAIISKQATSLHQRLNQNFHKEICKKKFLNLTLPDTDRRKSGQLSDYI